MTTLRQRMDEDMRLRGLAAKTRASYLQSVSQLARHYERSPDTLTQEEVRQYFLYRIELGRSSETINTQLCGVKFFFEKTLGREWDVYGLPFRRRVRGLPTVLTHEEVHRILGYVRGWMSAAVLWTMYETGARVLEAVSLTPASIDSDRMVVHILRGKGGKERVVPMAESTLVRLRAHWARHRNRQWLFPGRTGERHQSTDAVQRAFKRALLASEHPRRASTHTLRHSYATHLLERGVNIRVVQQVLGHKSVHATLRYLHVTNVSHDAVREAVEEMVTAP